MQKNAPWGISRTASKHWPPQTHGQESKAPNSASLNFKYAYSRNDGMSKLNKQFIVDNTIDIILLSQMEKQLMFTSLTRELDY